MTIVLTAFLVVLSTAQNAFATFLLMPMPLHDWTINVSDQHFGIVQYWAGQSTVYLFSWSFNVPFGAPVAAIASSSLLVLMASATGAGICAAVRNNNADHTC